MLDSIAISELIASAGLVVQLVNAFLILILLSLISKSERYQHYIRYWLFSWISLVASLFSITLYYFLPSDWITANVSSVINGCYIAFKVLFFGFLTVGMMHYVHPRTKFSKLLQLLKKGLYLLLVMLVIQVWVQLKTNLMVLLQSPIAIFAFIYSAIVLSKNKQNKNTLAITYTTTVLIFSGVLWISYLLVFPYDSTGYISILPGDWSFYTKYNSYYDLVLQTLLAFGQVMLIMQYNHNELEKAHNNLRQQSLTDHLTGSFNRQALHEHNRKSDQKKVMSIVVCDLDNLKVINDNFGHDAGDNILKHFVSEGEKLLRQTDSIYRWGGDEFIIALPETIKEDANLKMVKMQKEISSFCLEGGESIPVEFSFGISYCKIDDSIEDAISIADRRMYIQKTQRK